MKRIIIRIIGIFLFIPVLCFGKTLEDTVDILQDSITQDAKGKMYIGIKNISPLSDLARLCDIGEIFDKHGIPFIVEASSKMEAVEETQFKNYTQVLYYLQSKGGTICMPSLDENTDEEQRSTDEQVKQALSKEGIFLRQLPEDIYRIDFKTLERLEVNQKPFPNLGVDLVVEYDLPASQEEILAIVEWINDKWLRLSSFGEEEGYRIYSGKEEWLQDIDTQEGQEEGYSKFFTIGNKILLVVVSISICILGIGIIVGHLLYKEKFYKTEAKEKK